MLSNLLKKLGSIPQDKLLHIIAGVVIYLVSGLLVSPVMSLIIVVLVAIGKELWDSLGNGTPDKWDAIATIGGGVLCFILK